MNDMLSRIVERTREDLQKRKQKATVADLSTFELFESPRKGFRKALETKGLGIIAEVKKASPSKGLIRPDFDPVDIALRYEEGGAACLSVLTDEPFFQGSLQYLSDIRKRVSKPLLRKDFIVDTYQVFEAKAYGADAILLIMAVLGDAQLDELLHAAAELGLDVLTECYDQAEVDRMPFERANLFGVNNRDLRSFATDVHRGIGLLQQAPEGVVKVSESGLSTAADLKLLVDAGVDAALIGESLMRQPDPGKALAGLLAELESLTETETA